MIGIRNVGIYIPHRRVDNLTRQDEFDIDEDFIENKTGIHSVSRMDGDETTSGLCLKAFQHLCQKEPALERSSVDFVCVCTQNGDYQLPQTSSIVGEKLGLPKKCASFDVSLGCSGYVYSLLICRSFMESEGLNRGLVFTCDPYSKIIDNDNKNTVLLFGDGATVTLLSNDSVLAIGKGAYHTDGSEHRALIKEEGKYLQMDGRRLFNFMMRNVPPNIEECLRVNKIRTMDGVGLFLLHQASKYIVDNLMKRMKLDSRRVPFTIGSYGNTVSSSLPILLGDHLSMRKYRTILLCGFGVGLSIASLILKRR